MREGEPKQEKDLADVIDMAEFVARKKAEENLVDPETKESERILGTLSVLYEKYDDLLDELLGIVDYFDGKLAGDDVDRETTLEKIRKEKIKRLKELQEHTLNRFKSPRKQQDLANRVRDVDDLEDLFIERYNMFDEITDLIQDGVDKLVKIMGSSNAQVALVERLGLSEGYVEKITGEESQESEDDENI